MDNYRYLRKMGRGSYGEIWLVRSKLDKKQYVLKRIKADRCWDVADDGMLPAANLEARLLATLRHPNIVAYRDSFRTDDGYLHIAMSYCEGGDLHACIRNRRGVPFAESTIAEWFIQICMALQYLHSRNILHRDLKTQNIFLTKSRIVKLGDLGIAKELDGSSAMATTLIGTPYYMSPELFSGRPYDFKSDIWALGCCIYELVSLRRAFDGRDLSSLVRAIVQGKLPAMPTAYSAALLELIRGMLSSLPQRRPTVARILRHQYIADNIKAILRAAATPPTKNPSTDVLHSDNSVISTQRQETVKTRKAVQEPTKSSAPENTSRPTCANDRRPQSVERDTATADGSGEIQDSKRVVSSAVRVVDENSTPTSAADSSCAKESLQPMVTTHLQMQRNTRARQRRRQSQSQRQSSFSDEGDKDIAIS